MNNDEDLADLATDIGQELINKGLKLATAESCTGGWVSKAVTDIDGSSQWFECALVTYSNQAKHELLGVEQALLDEHGAVSQATVKAMVLGLLDRCAADVGISISGVAGPGGGSEEKPVGTVWIAWAKPGQVIEARRFNFMGDRESIRRQSVAEALMGVHRLITANNK